MADVSTTCKSGSPQISGRVVTRTPNSPIYTRDPKINEQAASSVQETRWGTRFDDLGYYDTPPTP